MTTDISTILEFRTHLRQCSDCELHKVGNGPVPWSGDPDCEFAIMAEAPGRTEDREGKPLVGDTGAILRHWLKQTGFDVTEMALFNAVSCWPDGTPTKQHMAACRGWANGQLEVIHPKVLITLGRVAFEQVRGGLRYPELKLLHGKPMRHPTYGTIIWPSYHPAAYLRGRNKTYETKIVNDLIGLRDWWARYTGGESWPTTCAVCGDDFYNWDEWSIPFCLRHSRRQGILFPEDSEV